MPGIQLSPIILIPGAIMLVLALAFIIGWKVTEKPPWSLFLWGALAMFISFLLRTLIEVFGSDVLFAALSGIPENVAAPIYYFYVAFVAALFDVALMLFVVRVSGAKRASWAGAVALGIGFGASWTLILGFSGLFNNLRALLSPDLLAFEEIFQMQAFIDNFWTAFPPQVVERLAAIVGNITAAVLVIYAYRARRWRYFWAALAYATLVSGAPIWVIRLLGAADVTGLWITVAVMAVLAIVGLLIVNWFKPLYQEQDEIDAARAEEEEKAEEEEEEELFGEIKPIFHTSPQDREAQPPAREEPEEAGGPPPTEGSPSSGEGQPSGNPPSGGAPHGGRSSGVEDVHGGDQPPAKNNP